MPVWSPLLATTSTRVAASFRWKAISMAAASRLRRRLTLLDRRQGRLVLLGTGPAIRGRDSRRGSFRLRRFVAAGFSNVTCSMGNHLNAYKFRQLCDSTRTVYLTFDADTNSSGQLAAQALSDRLREQGVAALRVS